MLARFQARYPTGSLISELLQIYEGKSVVRAEVQVDGVTRATGLAAAENLELAEDRARSRALMVLLPELSSDTQPGLPARHLSGMSEEQPDVRVSLPLTAADNKHPRAIATTPGWNSSISSPFAAVPTAEESTLIPSGSPRLTVENNGNPVPATPLTTAEVTGEPNSRRHDLTPESHSESMLPFDDEEAADSYDESFEDSVSESEPEPVAEVKKPVNMTEAFARTTTELKRLDWNTQQGRSYLKQTYGKTSRQQLTDEELLEFLAYLESEPTPNRLPFES